MSDLDSKRGHKQRPDAAREAYGPMRSRSARHWAEEARQRRESADATVRAFERSTGQRPESPVAERLERYRGNLDEQLRQSRNAEENALRRATRDPGADLDATLRAATEQRRNTLEALSQQAEALDRALTAGRTREICERLDQLNRAQRDDQLRLAAEWRRDSANEQNATGDAQLRQAMKSYQEPFANHDALRALWDRAADKMPPSNEGFKRARERFWRLVNNEIKDADGNEHAGTVRRMLRTAGYEIQAGTRAPMLGPELGARSHWRDGHARQLTIDHIVPKSTADDRMSADQRWKIYFSPENLRFELFDENHRKLDNAAVTIAANCRAVPAGW
jgi:hypothetical protein